MLPLISRIPTRMPVYLMASFARSGETLLLRTLNAHPKIMVLHQIFDNDSRMATRLARKISTRDALHAWVPLGLRKRGSSHLVVKHGTWAHKFPHRGFTFARNPFAIATSMKRYAVEHGETEEHRRKRLARWARGIDGTLVDPMLHLPEIEALSLLYRTKMKSALDAGHPVFHYEKFTADPAAEIAAILKALALSWDESVLRAESAYPPGSVGHGGIDLSKPIKTGLPAYAGGLTDEEFETVARITEPVLKPLGYAHLLDDCPVKKRN